MVQPFTDLFPDVSIGYIGLERDEETAVARSYYCKLPLLRHEESTYSRPDACDGGSAVQAIKLVNAQKPAEMMLVCIVCAPEGVRAVEEIDPQIKMFRPPWTGN